MTAAIGASITKTFEPKPEQTSEKSIIKKDEKSSASVQLIVKNKVAIPFSFGKLAAQDAQSQERVQSIRKLWLTKADCGYLD